MGSQLHVCIGSLGRVFVPMPRPFDFARTVGRFGAVGEDRVNRLADGRLTRVLAGRAVTMEAASGGVLVEPGRPELVRPVRRLLGAHADLGWLDHVPGSADPVLADLAGRLRGLRPALVPDPFEMLVTSITAQQVSQAAALAMRNRFVEAFGQRHGAVYAFPDPAAVARVDESTLAATGLSRQKARYVRTIATSRRDFADLTTLDDDDVVAALTELPGIGRWSAEWYLARHLGRPDIWPAGDLALRRALERFCSAGSRLDDPQARRLGDCFRPHRTLACLYLLAAARMPTEETPAPR